MTDVWIFGYGSLVWRPDMPFAERRAGHIRGWTRRFWQGSPDHRGTPDAPGRVVTLVRAPDELCWGTAYRIDASHAPDVLERLDHREKAGYERHTEPFTSDDGNEHALLYVAGPRNPNFLGDAPLVDMAAQVRACVGPSGPNREYVMRLAEALRDMGADDPHVFAVADAVAAGSS